MPAQQLAECWLKAHLLQPEAVAEVRRQVHGEMTPVDNTLTDESFMANTTSFEDFVDIAAPDVSSAVRPGLAAEDVVEAFEEAVYMVLK